MATSVQSSTSGNSALDALMGKNKSTGTAAAGSEDQFLNLLVTQLKNQDPLNPMDNAQMTSQLAQINTVKGIGQVNANLEKLVGAYADATSMQASSLIGKNVLVPGSDILLGSAGGVGGVELADSADYVKVVIKNAAGAEVSRQELGAQKAGVVTFTWDGKDAAGEKALSQGAYTFAIEATKGETKVATTALEAGTVSALVKGKSGFQLEVGGAGLVDFSTVKQVF